MNDTELYLSFRKYGIDGIWKAFQAIDTSNKDIVDSSTL